MGKRSEEQKIWSFYTPITDLSIYTSRETTRTNQKSVAILWIAK